MTTTTTLLEQIVPAGHPLRACEPTGDAPLTFAELPDSHSSTLRAMLHHDFDNVDALRFLPVRVPLAIITQLSNDPEDYLLDPDVAEEDAADTYRMVMDISARYAQAADAVPPITIGVSLHGTDQIAVYGGYHRCSAAREATAQYAPATIPYLPS